MPVRGVLVCVWTEPCSVAFAAVLAWKVVQTCVGWGRAPTRPSSLSLEGHPPHQTKPCPSMGSLGPNMDRNWTMDTEVMAPPDAHPRYHVTWTRVSTRIGSQEPDRVASLPKIEPGPNDALTFDLEASLTTAGHKNPAPSTACLRVMPRNDTASSYRTQYGQCRTRSRNRTSKTQERT